MGGSDLGALKKGDLVWAMHDTRSWLPARFKSRAQGKLQVGSEEKKSDGTIVEGETFLVEKSEKKCVLIKTIREGDLHDGIEDMQRLQDVHEASLLHTLRVRLNSDKIYTWTGPILISVNPYFVFPSLYGMDQMRLYNNKSIEDNPPHVYAIGDAAYRQMLQKSKNQSMIISGESGAGKTEATKHILQYFASLGTNASETAIHHKILSSNPLLEAFGAYTNLTT
jgi:myosin-5